MSFEILIIFSIALFFASLVHTTIGFGLLLIATPIYALFTDVQTAILYLLLPTIIMNILSIYSSGNFLNTVKKFFPLAILTTIGTGLGTQILIQFESEIFKILLAFTIFFYLFSKKLNINYSWINMKPKLSLITFGLGAGIIGGLTNAIAPFLMIYSLEKKFTKDEIIQSSNLCFLFGKFIQLLVFYLNGNLIKEDITNSIYMLPIVFISFYIGIKIRGKINAENYKKIINYLLIIIASSLIIKSLY